MRQAIDTRTREMPGLEPHETGNGGGRMLSLAELLRQREQLAGQLKRRAPRGAYAGAVKLGCRGHELRARTGLSQAEFARRAGVSERSLRTWEAAENAAQEAPKVHAAIVSTLAALGVSWAPKQTPPARYRCPRTWQTWSGRGQMPVWLRVALADGARLADFELRAA